MKHILICLSLLIVAPAIAETEDESEHLVFTNGDLVVSLDPNKFAEAVTVEIEPVERVHSVSWFEPEDEYKIEGIVWIHFDIVMPFLEDHIHCVVHMIDDETIGLFPCAGNAVSGFTNPIIINLKDVGRIVSDSSNKMTT